LEIAYISGVIATKEKTLLKEKLNRLCELPPDEAFRFLTESGYGSGAEGATSAYDYEKLIQAEEASLDDLIRTYAPSRAEREYLLAPHDFHNAKALFKAKVLGTDATPMLAPMGLIEVTTLADCVQKGTYGGLNPYLASACEQADSLLEEGQSPVNGQEVGGIFDKAMYSYLAHAVRHNRELKRVLAYRADVTNILTAVRAKDEEEAQGLYVEGGKLKQATLSLLFSDDTEAIEKAFKTTPYSTFVAECIEAKHAKLPFTTAEKRAACAELDAFDRYRYDMEKNHPFLYYVFRRKAENADVRIIFVCLLAGMPQSEIRKRRRTS
jgi:vacuolar-type H+-ATPase subunit C/Vma6